MYSLLKNGKNPIFDHSTFSKVWFWALDSQIGYLWPSNYQNQPLKFGHQVVLMSGFIFFQILKYNP
jgi:hypothetical protein